MAEWFTVHYEDMEDVFADSPKDAADQIFRLGKEVKEIYDWDGNLVWPEDQRS